MNAARSRSQPVPPLLIEWVEQRLGEADPTRVATGDLREEALRVFAASDFVAYSLARSPSLLQDLVERGDLVAGYPRGTYGERLRTLLSASAAGPDDYLSRLRRWRRREMVRIAWRDLAGRAVLDETLGDLSDLADAAIDETLRWLTKELAPLWGLPLDSDDQPMELVVLGMGKLGGRELNFSSDIDLIFCYPEEGETRGGRRSITHQEYFIRLGQRLIQALDAVTADGFVFRVDMRLRPFGEASPLAVSFDAMEEYYQNHGREWERYALIKARAVAGDLHSGEKLLERLKPFVYRRYIDFGAFESLREMKGMIEREVRRKGQEHNVKLGRGGIREVEFIGQAFQLIRGGRVAQLQSRSILEVLHRLAERGLLPAYVVQELVDSYQFLRDVENRIQMFDDRQNHDLPQDEPGRRRLAFSMDYSDWESFERELSHHRQRVHDHFEQVFAAPQGEQSEGDLASVWRGAIDPQEGMHVLHRSGFTDAEAALHLLTAMREGARVRALSDQGHQRLDRLMPLLLGAVAGSQCPDQTLKRILHLVESIARRTSYLALLVENPMALSQLVRLCAASPWIADLLTRHPLLLDELLDPRALYHPPSREELERELTERMAGLDTEDVEQQLDRLRHFRHTNTLRVAAADVMGAMPLMVVSDRLTELAEVVLNESLRQAWLHMEQRHGRPQLVDYDTGFAVIAYGKLGGIELGYGSDLDLVFLHADQPDGHVSATDGARPLENAVFYARLAQRLIHTLTTRTASGELYELDLRLRPSGASGMLVTHLAAFDEYQRQKAWTWEHQALVRARAVAGDPRIAKTFERIRREVLGRERELEPLREEVRTMRERMRTNLSRSEGEAGFDLKQDAGGIADIEFMVQYAVLAWAHRHPDLLDFTDNIRQIEGLARNGLLPDDDARLLTDAYRAYRSLVHRLTLQELPPVVNREEVREYRAGVERIWRGLMEPKSS